MCFLCVVLFVVCVCWGVGWFGLLFVGFFWGGGGFLFVVLCGVGFLFACFIFFKQELSFSH